MSAACIAKSRKWAIFPVVNHDRDPGFGGGVDGRGEVGSVVVAGDAGGEVGRAINDASGDGGNCALRRSSPDPTPSAPTTSAAAIRATVIGIQTGR